MSKPHPWHVLAGTVPRRPHLLSSICTYQTWKWGGIVAWATSYVATPKHQGLKCDFGGDVPRVALPLYIWVWCMKVIASGWKPLCWNVIKCLKSWHLLRKIGFRLQSHLVMYENVHICWHWDSTMVHLKPITCLSNFLNLRQWSSAFLDSRYPLDSKHHLENVSS